MTTMTALAAAIWHPNDLVNSGEIILQHVGDGLAGVLSVADARSIPFSVTRVYWITGTADGAVVRGKHAHKTLQQALFCVHGSVRVDLDDGNRRASVVLDAPHRGLYLGPLLWHEMREFSPGCVLVVLASARYDESDYLRSYGAYRAHLAGMRIHGSGE